VRGSDRFLREKFSHAYLGVRADVWVVAGRVCCE